MHPNSENIQQHQHPIGAHLEKVNSKLTPISKKLNVNNLLLLVMLTYPLIILVGQIVWYVSPDEMEFNYFTQKKNFINVCFVKQGWFWTSLFYALFLYSVSNDNTINRKSFRLISSVKKFVIVTLCWYFFSQWCFGLPIMDRIFILTGGSCYNVPETKIVKSPVFHKFKTMGDFQIEELVTDVVDGMAYYYSNDITSRQCRAMKGRWHGGHDPSGHIFLLTLSSTFLLSEVFKFYDVTTLFNILKRFKNDFMEQVKKADTIGALKCLCLKYPVVLILMLVSLWLWMLLMTSMYFHSLLEKLFGLLFSYLSSIISFQV